MDRREPDAPSTETTRLAYYSSETFARPETVRFRPAEREVPHRLTREAVRTKRRLKGFLIEIQSDEARVSFVENGRTFIYDLPADPLRRAGVTMRNQPFQMDEIEGEGEDGSVTIGYRFLALASRSDAYIETLSFDQERRQKRDLILKEFGKTQD